MKNKNPNKTDCARTVFEIERGMIEGDERMKHLKVLGTYKQDGTDLNTFASMYLCVINYLFNSLMLVFAIIQVLFFPFMGNNFHPNVFCI